MSIEIDPKEVIEHLKEYGIERISEERLKCFIKDLKKLIKHDEKIHITDSCCSHYSSTHDEFTPSMQCALIETKKNKKEPTKEKIEKYICKSSCECEVRLNNTKKTKKKTRPDSTCNCNIMTDSNHVSSTHCNNCLKSELIKPITARNNNCMSSIDSNYCSNHEIVRPSTAHNHIVSSSHCDSSNHEFVRPSTSHNCASSTHCNCSKPEYTITACEPRYHNHCWNHNCFRPATTQCCYPTSHTPCFNPENSTSQDLKENTRPSSSVENDENHLKKSKAPKKLINDPVLLYHKYQSVWKKHKLPGENDHTLLRRAIREKMKYKP